MWFTIIGWALILIFQLGANITWARKYRELAKKYNSLVEHHNLLKTMVTDNANVYDQTLRTIHDLISKRHEPKGSDLVVISLDTMDDILTDMLKSPRNRHEKRSITIMRKGIQSTIKHIIHQASGFACLTDEISILMKRRENSKQVSEAE